jgi:hypothetical protein
MAMQTHLDGTELGVKALAHTCFPSYSGRKYRFQAGETVSLTDGYWDGGTRSTYVAVNLSTRTASAAGDLYDVSAKGAPVVTLQPGVAIVEHSIFCGKDMGITFHVHPEDAPKLLPDTGEATEDEQIVLAFTSSLKNTYGGRTNIRFTEAARRYGITQDCWNAAQDSLRSRKLLNKAGSITPQGRNVPTGDFRY